MARTKEFDPDAALRAALELFWSRGYEATSMADLVAHLGIGRASIYATFGSKRELYQRALERYAEIRDPDPVVMLSQPGPALPAVRALLESFARQAVSEEGRRGCFVVNTAVELAPHDERAARSVAASWRAIETALVSALVRARAQGELAEDRDPYSAARLLLVLLQGIRVVGKGDPDPVRVRDAVREALRLLE
ncbi:TetR/AcrR family transcriptional regulator [Marinitenerispora sediminis]|uniref:TetR family transcriptional regulator n=1 Tax=Marinitenerispora sediminis TaxID=1931232 RepID=A0A368T3L8_9ACTN|nr:TetR/AcrR family transcriptional regulator [Marinitenerispora sediminis]RCV49411.1 TetR family transcriptional regulator [Marinitenerispora sediminis]RCV52499.1 TetR family transcriptional regulator [Marinitenerispora sediminis]RCV56640.1 TetR family transcriptional regulator [Marinitenerispora sediminis]